MREDFDIRQRVKEAARCEQRVLSVLHCLGEEGVILDSMSEARLPTDVVDDETAIVVDRLESVMWPLCFRGSCVPVVDGLR